MNIKKWSVIVTIIIFTITITLYFLNENYVKKVSLFKDPDFNTVNNKESWKIFRNELNISKKNSKIENFQLILDNNNNIYSVNFDLVDKNNGEYTIYQYSNCFSCKSKEENKVNISKSTVTEWLQYEKLMYADSFFSVLDILNQKGFFNNKELKYKLIVSSGFREKIDLEGDYYSLENNELIKIDKADPRTVSSGYNLQVIESKQPESFSTNKELTKSVFIDNYLEE